jgi:hypothetical protein
MKDRTDAEWINESKDSRMSDWMKQVSRCRGRYRTGCGRASQCCAVSGTAVFEELSLLVLRECVEGRGQARPGQAEPLQELYSYQGQFQHLLDPMKSAQNRKFNKAASRRLYHLPSSHLPSRLPLRWASISALFPALSSSLRELALDGHKSPFQVAVHSCV